MTLRWTKKTGGYVSDPFWIRKVHGWRPNHPKRNWIWEPHGPGIQGLPAYEILADAKRCCENTPYGLAQALKERLDATEGYQTMYDHTHVTDDEAQLLTFIKEYGEQIIVGLEKVK